jgi:hypothetical protein
VEEELIDHEGNDEENKSLNHVKALIDAYPRDPTPEICQEIDVEKVLKYRHFIAKMPIFIRLINFTNHQEIHMCYDELKK